MKQLMRLLAAAMLAAFLATACARPARAQLIITQPHAHPHMQGHGKVTPQQKQQSNADISAAITQLSSAQSALAGGNSSGASGYINVALGDLSQALPIYHGYRVKAIQECRKALRQLAHPKRASLAGGSISAALSDANMALQNAGDEINEPG